MSSRYLLYALPVFITLVLTNQILTDPVPTTGLRSSENPTTVPHDILYTTSMKETGN